MQMSAERARALADLVVATGLLGLAAIAVFFVIPVEILEPRTRFGRAQGAMSPAALPYILCGLIGIAAFLYLLRSVARLRTHKGAAASNSERSLTITWQLLAIVACSAAYITTLDRISFAYTTPVYLVVSYLVLSSRPLRVPPLELLVVAIGAGAITLLIKVIFERGLQVYLGA